MSGATLAARVVMKSDANGNAGKAFMVGACTVPGVLGIQLEAGEGDRKVADLEISFRVN